MQPDPSVKKVLIHRLGSLGDTVVALPCLHLVARLFPHAERKLLTNFSVHAKAPAAASVIGESGLVHGYLRYTAGTRSALELLRLLGEIRSFHPDVLVYLMPLRSSRALRRDRWFFRAAGVRRIVGMADEKAMQPQFDRAAGLYESEAARLARCLRELGDAEPGDAASWDLMLSQCERETAAAAMRALPHAPLIVCGPGTKMQSKDWGVGNWAALLGRLGEKFPGHALAMVGSRDEATAADHAAQQWHGVKVNLCGVLNPREMAAVLEPAKIFLGSDSGPMHMAAAAGIPCVVPFSAVFLPGVWFPWGDQHQIVYHRTPCFGCQLETCIAERRRCLASISVDEMEAAAIRAMNGQRAIQALVAIA